MTILSKAIHIALTAGLFGPIALFADNFLVTNNGVGVTIPSLIAGVPTVNGQTVSLETFDSLTNGAQPGNQIHSSIGTYGAVTVGLPGGVTFPNSGPFVMSADQYGGGGSPGQVGPLGGGKYIVAANNAGEGNMGAFQLDLSHSANYFGLWWGAGDSHNTLYFFNGNALLATFTTADLIGYAAGCKNTAPSCYGNPTTNFFGQDSTEPYLYLNIFDTTGSFNRIVFAELPGRLSGFESDNHAVANLGIARVPEPATLGLFIGIGLSLLVIGNIRRGRGGTGLVSNSPPRGLSSAIEYGHETAPVSASALEPFGSACLLRGRDVRTWPITEGFRQRIGADAANGME